LVSTASRVENLIKAESDSDGVDTASLYAQVAQLKQDSDLLAATPQDLDVREKTGSAISDGLPEILTSRLKVTDSRLKNIQYPSNVEGLRTPRMNHLIWNQLSAHVSTQDSKMQKSLNALVGSLVAMCRAT